jgi:hypothetical protein
MQPKRRREVMGGDDSLPGCIGYYPKAVYPNNCQTCAVCELCRKFVPRERLAAVLAAVKEARLIIRGEKNE